jgi:hypothetical protein
MTKLMQIGPPPRPRSGNGWPRTGFIPRRRNIRPAAWPCRVDRWQAVAQGRGKRHQRAEGRVAPGRGRCRWQDGRRRGHPRADPARVLLRPGPPHRARAAHERADGGGPGVPAPHRFRRAGDLPDHRGIRSPAHGLLHLWLAACAGEHLGSGRKGQRDPARDRADHHLEFQGRGRGDVRARALRHPPPDREGRDGRRHPGAVPVFAVLPVDHLQGHDAGRAGGGVLPRPDG